MVTSQLKVTDREGSWPRATVRRRVKSDSVTSRWNRPHIIHPRSRLVPPRWSQKCSDLSAWLNWPLPPPPPSCRPERQIPPWEGRARCQTPQGHPGTAHQRPQCWTTIPISRQGQRPGPTPCQPSSPAILDGRGLPYTAPVALIETARCLRQAVASLKPRRPEAALSAWSMDRVCTA